MKKAAWLICILVFTSNYAQALSGHWGAGLRKNGGGFYLSSPDQKYILNFRGYGQFLGAFYSNDYGLGASRTDRPFSFSVRRARLSMEATVHRTFEFLLEWGTPTIPTITAGPFAPFSNLGVVEAHATARLSEEVAQLRVGKFTGPFSGENSRSPRSLPVVERSAFLTSLIAMPALDTQIGAMLFGRLVEGIVTYYLAVFNGNGQALTAGTDFSGDKEVQLKLVFQPEENFFFGVGYDTYTNPAQTFTLLDHAFVPFFTGTVFGRRHGVLVDFDWTYKQLHLYGETTYFKFVDSLNVTHLFGAMANAGLMIHGTREGGVEGVVRAEWAQVAAGTTKTLTSILLGMNVFVNDNYKYSLNYIAEIPAGGATAAAYSSMAAKHILYNQIQVRF